MTGSRSIVSDTVDIVDYLTTRKPAMIEDTSFVDCLIRGPAVLLPVEGVDFARCEFDTRQFWVLEDTKREYQGGIGLRNVSFHRCRFEDVGVAGPRDFVDRFFNS